MKKFRLFLIFFVLSAKQYSVEIRHAPVADVIRLLVSMENKNVIIPGDLTGTVIASFPKIELDDALNSVLESNQLIGSFSNGVLAVSTKKTQELLGKDLSTTSFNLKYAKAKEVGSQAKALLLGKGSILIDDRTNSITVYATKNQIDSIAALVHNIDKIDKQVLIEARIIEASKNFSRNLGVQWGINGSFGPLRVGGLAGAGTSQGGRNLNVGAPSSNPISGVSAALGPLGNSFIDLQISMGEENGTLSVLSRPSIVTMNNQPATIQSGLKFYVRTAGSVTIASGSSPASGGASQAPGGDPSDSSANAASSGATTGSTLQQITSGITLIVTPHITPDNKISLTINVVSSQVNFSQMVADIPSISDNTATTTVLLEDGATTVIGGLTKLTNSKSSKGIPWLARLPVIGPLFGTSSKGDSNEELLILLTPTVVKEALQDKS